MKRKTCPYCGKTCPSKLAVKTHKKVCKYIPENADHKIMGDIKNHPKPHTHFVKLVNQYGLHGDPFPPLQEHDSSHNVTLVSGDGSVMTCHAAVLAASSPYLAELLKEPCKDDDNVIIVAQNITAQQMNNLLQFLYLGKFIGNKGEVSGMKIILKEFQISYNTNIMDASFEDVLAIEGMAEGYADKVDTKKDVLGIDAIDYINGLTNRYINMDKDVLGIDTDSYTADMTNGYNDNVSMHKNILCVKTDNYPVDMNSRYIENVDAHTDNYPVNMSNEYTDTDDLHGINTDNHIIDLTERYEDKVDMNDGIIELDTIKYPKDITNGFKNNIDVQKDHKNEYTVSQNKKSGKNDKARYQVPSRKRKREKKAFSDAKLKSACEYCEIKSRNLNETMKHVQKEHPDLFDMFAKIHIKTQCQHCDQKFLDKKLLYQHKKNMHPESLPTAQRLLYNINDGLPFTGRKCPYCHKFIKTKQIGDYKDHIQQHWSGTDHPFSCDVCEKKFTKSYYLRVHKKKHQVLETPLLCNQCGSSFQTEFDYNKHNQTHIIKAKIEGPKKKYTPRPVDPNFSAICSTCGKSYTKKSSYMVHIKSAHDDKKLLKCPHCPTTSSSLNNLNTHMKLHLPPTLQCEHCPNKFPTRHYLKRHIRSRHLDDNQKDFVCDKCGKGFNEDAYAGYVGHLNMHAGLKPFKCRYCEMCYQNSSNRIAHEKSRHSDVYVKRSTGFNGVRINKR